MQAIFSAITFLGCVLGGLMLFFGVTSDSAPRMAALAATGVGFAVIPYIITRIIHMSKVSDAAAIRHAELMKAFQNPKKID